MTKILSASVICLLSVGLGSCQVVPAPATPAAVQVMDHNNHAADVAAPASIPQPQQTAEVTTHPGEGVYKTFCGACHDQPDVTRAPSKDTLKKMSLQFINFSLTGGKMKVQGSVLSLEQRAQLVNYLVGNKTSSDAWTTAMKCDAGRLRVDLTGPATITTFGFDRANTRSLTAQQAGLSKAQLSKMELAWSLGFEESTNMRSQGAVVGDNVFVPIADSGALYALDISDVGKPCLQWSYKAPGETPLRSSPGYGVLADGTPLLVISGLDATIHAVDARTGKAVWTKAAGSYSFSTATGTPTVLKDRVIVPISQFEILFAANNKELCCTNHGYVLSLDPKTGEQQWRYDTMPEATVQRDRGDGQPLMGPSGAPVWNSPIVDDKRGLIYFGTGESNSPPAHKNTNAIIAIDLKTGTEKWSFHATPQDIFNTGCGLNPKPDLLNCVKAPETVYRDVDFGASVVMGTHSDGSQLLYAGQKSGSVWAFEPDTGKVAWRTALGTGSALGGIHWGIAYDKDTVYAPISTVGVPIPGEWDGDPNIKPGLYALDAKTGKIKWQYHPEPPPGTPPNPSGRAPRASAMSAAPVIIDGVVIAATLDGTLHAIDAATGAFLWKKPTAETYSTLNGVPARGGSIDSASIYAANGLLMVNSGYGMFGQVPGNVLLAFKPAK